MKKHSRIPSVLAGAAVTLAAGICVTSALAVSGAATENVSFNQIQLDLDGVTILQRGEDLTLSTGAKIPSSIVYTDGSGGGVTYVPLKKVSEAVGAPLSWYGGEHLISMHVPCLTRLLELPLNCCNEDGVGIVFEDSMQEVPPVVPSAAANLLSPTRHQGQAAFERELPLDEGEGAYVSVTVANHGGVPAELRLGVTDGSENGATMYTASLIPAHSTVTRTMRLLEGAKETAGSLYIFAGHQECPFPECNLDAVDITVEAARFR